jgi:hypothetical protein
MVSEHIRTVYEKLCLSSKDPSCCTGDQDSNRTGCLRNCERGLDLTENDAKLQPSVLDTLGLGPGLTLIVVIGAITTCASAFNMKSYALT